jgi:hypothetical protein
MAQKQSEIEEGEIKPAKKLRTEAKTVWNNRSEEDFEKKKVFDGYDDHRVSANIAQIINTEVKRFLRRVDVSKVPIQKTIIRMFRIRAPDYDSPNGKNQVKEYLYWEENWNEGPDHFAKDHKNEIIAPVIAHVEGLYNETLVREVIEVTESSLDEEGEPIAEEQIRRRFNGLRSHFYIPFTKKTAEDVIKKSAHSDENSIRFIVKISPGDYGASGSALRHDITSDMFLNWSFDELFRWMTSRPKDAPLDYTRSSIGGDKSGKSLAFTPS